MPRPFRIVVFLQLDIEYGRGILRGIGQYFRAHPTSTVLKFMRPAAYQREAIMKLHPDGIIAQVSTENDQRVMSRLGVPVVNVSGMLRFPSMTTVNSDDLAVGRLAASHFLGRSHRHFAYVGDRHHAAARLRWEGFKKAAQLNGATAFRHYLPHDESDAPYPPRLRRELLQWIRSLPRPVGIFCFTDRVAVEVAEACEQAKLKVPEEVAILGTGNDATRLDFAHVEVSSIQLDTSRIGELAAETLHDILKTRPGAPAEILVPPLRISIRRSTDKMAVDDEVVAHALDYIGTHAANAIYVDEVARTVGVSRRSLELRFRRALGTSVYDQVQRIRFERVVELMTDPAMSLDEIAYSTGFGGLAAFSKMFRRHFQSSPSAYRKNILSISPPQNTPRPVPMTAQTLRPKN